MSETISHSGVVESISGNSVRVRILQTSACAACKVASHCNASEAKVKVVDVDCTDAHRYKQGQTVVVTASRAVANKALLVGFGLPLMVLMGTLVCLLALGYDEGTAALAALAMLVPYYSVVWLLRRRIGRSVAFAIEPGTAL